MGDCIAVKCIRCGIPHAVCSVCELHTVDLSVEVETALVPSQPLSFIVQ